jgi:hypothetical protein
VIISDQFGARSHFGIFVQGYDWGDVESLGKWLEQVGVAQRLYDQAKDEDPDFVGSVIDRLEVAHIWDFGIVASEFVSRSITLEPLAIETGTFHAEVFAVMTKMGFFVKEDRGYRMALPSLLDVASVKNAATALFATQDDEHFLYPQQLVSTIWMSEALRLIQNHRDERKLGIF